MTEITPMTEEDYACPESATSITENDGIKKAILKEGQGDLPPLHARCLVHYVGRLASDHTVFIDTKQESTSGEPAKLIAGRDSLIREVALHIAVATMKQGEVARLWVAPQYGYGSQGSFSFPTVPPNADLVYDIELLSYDAPDDDERDHRDLTYEERLETAERRRKLGNVAFKEGNYSKALQEFTSALSYVDEDLLIQLEGFHYDKAMECRQPALLNIAACHLKMKDYHAAINSCNQVLASDKKNVKALFRKGCARLALGQTEAAIEDLQAARKVAPNDSGITKELIAAKTALKQDKQAQKEVFAGLLDKNGGKSLFDDSINSEQQQGGSTTDAAAKTKDAAIAPPQQQQEQNGIVYTIWIWLYSLLQYWFPSYFGKTTKAHTD